MDEIYLKEKSSSTNDTARQIKDDKTRGNCNFDVDKIRLSYSDFCPVSRGLEITINVIFNSASKIKK